MFFFSYLRCFLQQNFVTVFHACHIIFSFFSRRANNLFFQLTCFRQISLRSALLEPTVVVEKNALNQRAQLSNNDTTTGLPLPSPTALTFFSGSSNSRKHHRFGEGNHAFYPLLHSLISKLIWLPSFPWRFGTSPHITVLLLLELSDFCVATFSRTSFHAPNIFKRTRCFLTARHTHFL